MTPGELIEQMILVNIRIWHEDTKLRNGINLSSNEIMKYGLAGRALNKDRSDIKYQINKLFDDNLFDDRKVNYSKGSESVLCSDTQSPT